MTDNKQMGTNTDLKIVSLNVKGLNHPAKRRKVLEYLSKTKGDIVVLQETRLSGEDADRIKAKWVGQAACSPAIVKKRGVITLINKKAHITLEGVQHEDGRMPITHLNRGGDKIHIVNVYGPNLDDPTFWDNISTKMEELPQDELMVMAGNFNLALDHTTDRLSQNSNRPPQSHRAHSNTSWRSTT